MFIIKWPEVAKVMEFDIIQIKITLKVTKSTGNSHTIRVVFCTINKKY